MRNYDVLMPCVRKDLNWESEKAERMFLRLLKDGFSYDDVSNHPDYPAYASAELLHEILPLIIDEMLKRQDTDNFLIYHVISSLDPEAMPEILGSEDRNNLERAKKIIEIADKSFAEKACQFLEAMKENPPNGPEQVDRLLSFWQEKLKELS